MPQLVCGILDVSIREPGLWLQALLLWPRHFRIHTETWSGEHQPICGCCPVHLLLLKHVLWRMHTTFSRHPEKSSKRQLRKASQLQPTPGRAWVLTGFSCPLCLLSSPSLIPTGVATHQHAHHWASTSLHDLQPSDGLAYKKMLPFYPRWSCYLYFPFFLGLRKGFKHTGLHQAWEPSQQMSLICLVCTPVRPIFS